MLGGILIACGTGLMGLGVVMLAGWLGGRSRWFGAEIYDRQGASKADRMALYVTFVAMVITPLISGAMLIAYGLYKLR